VRFHDSSWRKRAASCGLLLLSSADGAEEVDEAKFGLPVDGDDAAESRAVPVV